MNTLEWIEEHVKDPSCAIDKLFDKCLILGHKLDDRHLLAFVDKEINGYTSTDRLPAYRYFPARCYSVRFRMPVNAQDGLGSTCEDIPAWLVRQSGAARPEMLSVAVRDGLNMLDSEEGRSEFFQSAFRDWTAEEVRLFAPHCHPERQLFSVQMDAEPENTDFFFQGIRNEIFKHMLRLEDALRTAAKKGREPHALVTARPVMACCGRPSSDLLRKIRNIMVDNDFCDLVAVLRYLEVVAAQINDADLQRWINLELNGYDSSCWKDLPAYRRIPLVVRGAFFVPRAEGTSVDDTMADACPKYQLLDKSVLRQVVGDRFYIGDGFYIEDEEIFCDGLLKLRKENLSPYHVDMGKTKWPQEVVAIVAPAFAERGRLYEVITTPDYHYWYRQPGQGIREYAYKKFLEIEAGNYHATAQSFPPIVPHSAPTPSTASIKADWPLLRRLPVSAQDDLLWKFFRDQAKILVQLDRAAREGVAKAAEERDDLMKKLRVTHSIFEIYNASHPKSREKLTENQIYRRLAPCRGDNQASRQVQESGKPSSLQTVFTMCTDLDELRAKGAAWMKYNRS